MNHAHHGRRVLIVAIVMPALITIAAVIVLILLAGSGPSRVATHWVFSGRPDGYGSPFSYAILMAAVAVPLIALLGGGSVLLASRSALTRVIKLTAVAGLWMSSFLAVVFIGSLLGQRTASSVSAAMSPAPDIVGGVLAGAALALAGWFVLPRAVPRVIGGEPPATPAVALVAGERASWFRSTSAPRGALWVYFALTTVLGGVEILVVALTEGRAWWVLFVPVVLLVLMLSSFAWTVRVDARGVRVRSVIGVPSFTTPIANIVSATVVTVSPLSEFGGFGIRWSLSGRLGIIMRSGEALEIRRHKGMDMVVTVDDATTAAALINGLVGRVSEVPNRA